jgi:hypothetical protein
VAPGFKNVAGQKQAGVGVTCHLKVAGVQSQRRNNTETLTPESRYIRGVHLDRPTMTLLRYTLPVVILATSLDPAIALAQSAATHSAAETLTPQVLSKMLSFNAANGHDGEMPAPITAALGLTAAGQSWPDRQVAVVAHDTGAVHAIAASRGVDKDIILSVKGPVAISVFRIRSDGALVGAVEFFLATKLASPMTPDEARATFADECAFWSAHINGLVGPG